MRFNLFYLLLTTYLFSQSIKFDTLVSQQVGPDMFYYKIVESTKPWSIDVFKMNLKNPNVRIEAVKAKDKITGYESPLTSCIRKQKPNYYPVAAINADFYSSTEPIGFQVNQGQVVKMPGSFSTIGFDVNNKPFIHRINNLTGSVIKGNTSCTINGVNKVRASNELIIYNKFFNTSTTQTNTYGTEILVKLLPNENYYINDTIQCIVLKKEVYKGNMGIDEGCFVISGHGNASNWLENNININDTIKVVIKISPSLAKIKEVIGAYPKIVYNGQNYSAQGVSEEGGPSHAPDRHPRSAAGISQDSTYLYLIAVDGRNPHSIGMTLNELADFMLKIGVFHGVNFDGGGSTCLVVNKEIKNVPSDGSPRNVSNSLVIFTTIEPSNQPVNFKLKSNYIKLFRGQSFKLSAYANDSYGFPSTYDTTKIKFSIDTSYGKITNNTLFSTNKGGITYLYLFYDNMLKDSAKVFIKRIKKVSFSTKNFVSDTSQKIKLLFKAYDDENVIQYINFKDFNVSLSNPTIAQLNKETGEMKFLKEGETKIFINIDDFSDTLYAKCIIRQGNKTLIDFSNTQLWHLEKENIDTAYAFSFFDTYLNKNVLGIHYYFVGKSNTSQNTYLVSNLPIEGIPDSLYAIARSDGKKHHINYIFSDDNNELFRNNTLKYFDKNNYDIYPIAIKNMSAINNGTFYFPINLIKIQIEMLYTGKINGQVYSGDIYFDKINLVYPKNIVSLENLTNSNNISKDYQFKIYPNPFNPTTTIQFNIPERTNVKLTVYDMLGREIQTLINNALSSGFYNLNFNGSNLPSGIYFTRLEAGKFISVKKILLIK
ncbi:MAG TPA: phosphodiester glycosidase family protein [Ignavibacteriales bacterium]|nr:phosphodiester glycosidase family protein [Ignavibacteriales bacterium]